MNRTWWTGLLVGGAVSAVVLTAVTGLKAQNRGAASLGRVVCLDVIKIFNEYQRHKDLDEELRAAKEDMRNEAERRVGQIDSLQATLDAMSPDDPTLLRRHREMLQLQLDYKNWSDLMQAEMAREIGVWNKRTYAEVLAVVPRPSVPVGEVVDGDAEAVGALRRAHGLLLRSRDDGCRADHRHAQGEPAHGLVSHRVRPSRSWVRVHWLSARSSVSSIQATSRVRRCARVSAQAGSRARLRSSPGSVSRS